MYKVLIADNARQLVTELVSVLGDAYAIRLWRGEPLRALVQSWQPDVLVLDLQLHSCDAMALLQELHMLPKEFMILASTCAVPEYTLTHLGNLGVDYLLKKPCEASHLAQCIRSMLRYRSQKCISTDTCDAVFDHARKLGISCEAAGIFAVWCSCCWRIRINYLQKSCIRLLERSSGSVGNGWNGVCGLRSKRHGRVGMMKFGGNIFLPGQTARSRDPAFPAF